MPERIEVDVSADVRFKSPIVTKEALIGVTNDLMPIHFILEGAKTQQAVARLLVKGTYKGKPAQWFGTGFMISDDLLMTNHHVLPSLREVTECTAEFNFQSDWDGVMQKITRYPCDLNYYVSNEGLDFAIIKVLNSPGGKFGRIKLDYTTTVMEGESVYIIQHPRGREKEVALQNNHVARIKNDSTDNFSEHIVHYTTDTEPGSSGSPVFTKAWDLVALHHASTNSGTTLVNEGILTSQIIAYLAKRALPAKIRKYVKTALYDSNLPGPLKKSLGMESAISPRFFGSEGLETREITGYEKVVTTSGGTEFFDLASWNIMWFGSTGNATDERVSKIADYMHAMGMDLWGLVEVAEPALEKLQEFLKTNYNQKFKILTGKSTNLQKPAVFYDGEKVECEKRDSKGAFDGKWSGKQLFPRKPFWVYVKAEGKNNAVFNFNLVVLHLKAMGDNISIDQRKEEIKVLHSWLKTRIKSDRDKDYILVGDWNDKLDSGPFETLKKDRKLGILTKKDAESGNKDAVSYVSSPKSLIDHIIISKDAKAEYVKDSIEIVRSDKVIPKFVGSTKTGYSDHVPLVARFIYNKGS